MDKVVHLEIPFEDKNRAMEFYKKLFGWKLNDLPDMDYVLVQTGEVDKKQMPKEKGTINGGMMQKRNESGPVIVMQVSSVDKYVKKLKKWEQKLQCQK
ncbi:MAG: VOC family protein [archaeon]|nr:VOC family protein [archaeon]